MGRLIELYRMVRNLVSLARVISVDDSGDLQTVTLEGYRGELRSDVPVIGTWGVHSNPPADAEALVLSVGGDRGRMVAIGTEDRSSRRSGGAEESVYLSANANTYVASLGGFNTTQVVGSTVQLSGAVNHNAGAVQFVPGTDKNFAVFSQGTGTINLYSFGSGAITLTAGTGGVVISATTVSINGTNHATHTHTVPAGTDSSGGVTGAPQ